MAQFEICGYDLRDLQMKMLEILTEIDRVCKLHNINYVLDSGTLLGAVRHKGFIPWDDDMDICMLREDYDKFKQVAVKDLGEKYVFEDMTIRPNFPNLFGKCYDVSTCVVESATSHLDIRHCAWVDIFPIDNITMEDLGKHSRLIASINTIRALKLGTTKFCFKRIAYLPFMLIPLKLLNKFCMKQLIKHNQEPTEFVHCLTQPGLKTKGRQRNWYTNVTRLPFEGHMFSVPGDYMECLNRMFHNNLGMPPEDKQHPTHHISKMKL